MRTRLPDGVGPRLLTIQVIESARHRVTARTGTPVNSELAHEQLTSVSSRSPWQSWIGVRRPLPIRSWAFAAAKAARIGLRGIGALIGAPACAAAPRTATPVAPRPAGRPPRHAVRETGQGLRHLFFVGQTEYSRGPSRRRRHHHSIRSSITRRRRSRTLEVAWPHPNLSSTC